MADKIVEVVLDRDNVKIGGVEYKGMRGKTVKVSPATAEKMRKHKFIVDKGGNNG